MNRHISETPKRWVILEVPNNYHKVFCSWGDRWRINSGIESVEQDDDFYYFTGFSGSCYKCHKKQYGIPDAFASSIILDKILELGKDQVKLLEDVEDWSTVV